MGRTENDLHGPPRIQSEARRRNHLLRADDESPDLPCEPIERVKNVARYLVIAVTANVGCVRAPFALEKKRSLAGTDQKNVGPNGSTGIRDAGQSRRIRGRAKLVVRAGARRLEPQIPRSAIRFDCTQLGAGSQAAHWHIPTHVALRRSKTCDGESECADVKQPPPQFGVGFKQAESQELRILGGSNRQTGGLRDGAPRRTGGLQRAQFNVTRSNRLNVVGESLGHCAQKTSWRGDAIDQQRRIAKIEPIERVAEFRGEPRQRPHRHPADDPVSRPHDIPARRPAVLPDRRDPVDPALERGQHHSLGRRGRRQTLLPVPQRRRPLRDTRFE